MREFGKWLGRVLLAIAAAAVATWVLAPREVVDTGIEFDAELTVESLEAYFAETEAAFDDIRPGQQKQVVWADGPGQRTDLAIVYIHGFSASPGEIRPVPDRVAESLGANLVYARLTGHGRTGKAMAEARAGDWLEDTAEALAAGRAAADKTVVIATSTGGTLAAIAAVHPDLKDSFDAVVLVSPNFRIADPRARILTWPFVRLWGPLVAGAERSVPPVNDDHAANWSTRYPTVALIPLAVLVKYAQSLDFAAAEVPALFMFSDGDRVVDPAATRDVADAWGGEVALAPQKIPPGNDANEHVIAGDILSPGMTDSFVRQITGWLRSLEL